jgi:uncharacterized membrane protein
VELGRFFGFLHPALVHFPLVLLLVSVALEAVGFFRRDARFTWAAQTTLILGTVATLFAFVCGNFAEIWAARDGVPQDPMELHELYATITSCLFVFLAAARLYMGSGAKRQWMAVYLVFALAGCILLGITGHKGAMLVYQHGAGVQLGTQAGLPTHEDLAVLRQKQDPEALFYSNNMHHVFGWMVMVLSSLLLVDMLSPKAGAKLRKVTPLLLLAGGIFLMIYSDTDSWPLSHQRPITDKEVLMHKTYAGLMLFFGIQGLLRRKKKPQETLTSDSSSISPGDETLAGRKRQGRAMAVFSLIGGALLFTHVHSNAPYANVAAGVYIHHTVMGFIALCIGAVKLLEDALPERAKRWQVRALAWAYPCLMLTESIFLINYNEGLPWFLGYRNLSLSAPHKGLIAPLGKDRAELVFNSDTSRMDVYLYHQENDLPLPVSAETIQAVTKIGTESTTIPLAVVPEPEGRYHFAGTATFLHNTGMFEAQVLVEKPGAKGADAWQIADFEPWTDERLASGQHSQAAFVCPHHPAVGSGTAGRCSVCGMALVPNKPARPWDKLHDDNYAMALSLSAPRMTGQRTRPIQIASTHSLRIVEGNEAAPAKSLNAQRSDFLPVQEPQPGQPTRLHFSLRRADGSRVKDFEVVHTKKLHLIVVSKDLAFFDHIHPAMQSDGSLILDYAFPQPGEYILYADCTPTGDRNQVFSLPVTVVGTPPAPQPLQITPAQAKVFGNYRVRLDLSPQPPQPRDETQVSFTVYENGVPVSDLEPYLGAGGHCVALSEDTRSYLHSHPLEMNGTRFGPTVTFHTLFPRRGLYKIWGQFQHHGKILVADFVVRVP